MKRILYIFTLLSVWLTGTALRAEAGAVIRYDFMTSHPVGSTFIEDSNPVIRNGVTFWGGTWGGLFAGKIAFENRKQFILSSSGGLYTTATQAKLYILYLGTSDVIRIKYSGANASVTYAQGSVAQLAAEVNSRLESETAYSVSRAGNLTLTLSQMAIIEYIEISVHAAAESVSIPDGIRTYCSSNPLHFTGDVAVRAYVATDFRNGRFVFRNVSYVPANTGVLLVRNGTDTAYQVEIGMSTDPNDNVIPVNMFTGVLAVSSVPSESGADHYVVGKTDTEVGIFKVNTGFSLKAQSAYLTVPK